VRDEFKRVAGGDATPGAVLLKHWAEALSFAKQRPRQRQTAVVGNQHQAAAVGGRHDAQTGHVLATDADGQAFALTENVGGVHV